MDLAKFKMIRESEIEEVPEDRDTGRNEQLEIAEPVEACSTEDLLARLPSDNWQDKWMNVASWVTLRNLVWNWNVNDRDPVSEEIEADMQQEQHSEENTANMADPPNEILPIDIVSYPDTTNERCEVSRLLFKFAIKIKI